MFEGIKVNDKVLIMMEGEKSIMFEDSRSFLVPAKVSHVTAKRLTVNGTVYKKCDGASVPRGLCCTPYTEGQNETGRLNEYNEAARVIRDIDNLLPELGRSKVNRETKGLYLIRRQAEILADMLAGGKGEGVEL